MLTNVKYSVPNYRHTYMYIYKEKQQHNFNKSFTLASRVCAVLCCVIIGLKHCALSFRSDRGGYRGVCGVIIADRGVYRGVCGVCQVR